MPTSTIHDLIKRHGVHHFINVKYGYFIFFLTLIHITYLYISRRVYIQKWITSGRSTTFKRLISIPDVCFLVCWIIVLIVMLFWKFNIEEITIFVKRLGRFAYVLLPFDIFISLKPNPLPNVYYLELIFLHKWISRLSICLGFLHSVGFVIVWLKRGTFMKIFKLLNFLGVIALTGYLVISFVSLRYFRRRAYKLFFSTHLILVWFFVALLQFHSRPGVAFFTFLNVFLLITQVITKFWKSTDIKIQRFSRTKSNLEVIQLPNIFRDFKDFNAGSHLRLSYPRSNVLNYVLPSHPFTIASRPDEQVIKLIVRKNKLNLNTDKISVFGPFPTMHQNFFKTADQALLVAGGSGISFILGLYSELIKNSSVNVTLVWVLKNEADLWILEHFNIKKIDIYITKPTDGYNNTANDIEEVIFEENENLLESTNHGDFELDDLDPFDDVNEAKKSNDRKNKTIKYGRPNISSYSNTIQQYDKANNWIVSCGTDSLNDTCQQLAKSLEVRYHGESYVL